MYRAILHKLPIPLIAKILLVLVVLAGVALFCFIVFFPWVVQFIPYPFGTMGAEELGV
jgi:hypothetical protein